MPGTACPSPYVRHPEGEEYLEERWLYEGITETYVPILQMLEKLAADDIDFRITISSAPRLSACCGTNWS